MNLGFSYVCTAPPESPGLPSMQSQPAYDSNSLPRRNARGRHVLDRAPSADLANARRKLVSSAVQDYLKSLNAMTRSIVMERETLEEDHGQHWSGLNVTKREEIMNEHFVPSGVRARYQADARPRYPHRNRPHSAGRTLRVPQGDGMHLSQPSVWEDYEAENDLVMKNKAASWVSGVHAQELATVHHSCILTHTHTVLCNDYGLVACSSVQVADAKKSRDSITF